MGLTSNNKSHSDTLDRVSAHDMYSQSAAEENIPPIPHRAWLLWRFAVGACDVLPSATDYWLSPQYFSQVYAYDLDSNSSGKYDEMKLSGGGADALTVIGLRGCDCAQDK